MILCTREIDRMRDRPENEWNIREGGFPVYYLFPNVIINVATNGIIVVRVYPDPKTVGRSISQISFYFDREVLGSEEADRQLAAFGLGARAVNGNDFALSEQAGRPRLGEGDARARRERARRAKGQEVGNEGEGLASATRAAADLRVRIPMVPGADSLNVAVACGIALHRIRSGR